MSTQPDQRSGAGSVIDVRRAGERPATRIDWLDSRHSFSFGHHHDPANTHHGVLLVNNDDIVLPGTGFDTHPHRNMEIVTWVLDGSLVHQDSEGNNGVIYPGLAQRMSAGTGIMHSEKNDAWRRDIGRDQPELPVHFLQMWVLPDQQDLAPGYEQLEIDDARLRSGLVTVASGMAQHADDTAIRINNRYAALHVARLGENRSIIVPDAPFAHVFVARGEVAMEGAGDLGRGDAVRLTGGGGQRIDLADDAGDAEVLIWEMHAGAA